MENFLTEVAKQVPSLGVLCFIVWVFIKHIGAKDEALKEIHRENLIVIRDNSQAIRENSESRKEYAVVISELKSVIHNKLEANGR